MEQLTRYLELLNRDPLLSPVHGVLAAQTIKLQARTLAEDRGIRCVVLDYDAMRGIERVGTLFLTGAACCYQARQPYSQVDGRSSSQG